MTSFIREFQDVLRDFLKTDEDFSDIAIFTDSSLDIWKDIERALTEDGEAGTASEGERKGICIVIGSLGGALPSADTPGVFFMPASFEIFVIENPEINRKSGGNVRFCEDVSATVTLVLKSFRSGETGFTGVGCYPAEGVKQCEPVDLDPGWYSRRSVINCNVGDNDETPVVATPVIVVDVNTRTATITCATEFADIYYTTDGSRPTPRSSLYSSAIDVSAVSTLRARAYRSSYRASLIATTDIGAALLVESGQNLTDEGGETLTNE